MKTKLTLALILSLALIAGLIPHTARAGVNDFSIPIFEGDYYLTRDSTHVSHLRVHEHLMVQFPDFDQNHGILRAIPETYANHPLNLHVQTVTDNTGRAVNYTTSDSNDNLVLKIGDAGTYVHGQQTYNLDYTMDNVTTDNDAFIWNTNGDQWSQSFGSVIAHIHLSGDLAAAVSPANQACFTGGSGSTAKNCISTSTLPGSPEAQITVATTRPLQANENLTTALHFNAGTFAAYKIPPAELLRFLAIALLGYTLPIFLTLFIVIRRWRKYGRDPKGAGTIIPEYLPPKDLSVLGSSAIIHEGFENKALTAQIIDLAVRHYLKIYEVKQAKILKDKITYDIELTTDPKDLRPEELAVLNLLFSDTLVVGTKVSLDQLAGKLYAGAANIGDSVNQQLAESGSFRADPADAKSSFYVAGIILLGTGSFTFPYAVGFIVAGVILLISAKFMPARTKFGVQQKEYLLGLKLYMHYAETDRLKFLQSPHGEGTEKIDVTDTTQLIKLYERLLPYAMLFGIEKDWAKEFAGLYKAAPEWYAGNSAFSAAYFVGSISGFSAQSTASFNPPHSSSGGSFSGGGGGGGGGGGW